MIPEPFTLTVAGIGIATAILNLFITSIQKVYEVYNEYQNALVYLENMRHKVESCEQTLQQWWNLFEGNGDKLQQHELVYILGATGYRGMRDRSANAAASKRILHKILRRAISDETSTSNTSEDHFLVEIKEDAADALELSKPPENSNLHSKQGRHLWFKGIWKHHPEQRSIGAQYDRGTRLLRVKTRLFFAFIQAADLRRSVENFSNAVSELKTFTDQSLELLPKLGHVFQESVSSQVRRILDLRHDSEEVCKLLDAVFDWQSDDATCSCRIVLRYPDEEGSYDCLSNCDSVRQMLSVSLLVQHFSKTKLCSTDESRVVQVTYPFIKEDFQRPLAVEAIEGNLKSISSTVTTQCPHGRPERLREVLASMSEFSDRQRILLRETQRKEILLIAIKYINWSLILWNTRWTAHICSCNLLYYKRSQFPQVTNDFTSEVHLLHENHGDSNFHGTCDFLKSEKDTLQTLIHQWQDSHKRMHGVPDLALAVESKCKMLIIGNTLCELALWCPIRVQIDSNGKCLFTLDQQTIDAKGMVRRVRERYPPLRQCVEKFISAALNPSWHLRRPELIVDFAKTILDPLTQAYDSIYAKESELCREKRWHQAALDELKLSLPQSGDIFPATENKWAAHEAHNRSDYDLRPQIDAHHVRTISGKGTEDMKTATLQEKDRNQHEVGLRISMSLNGLRRTPAHPDLRASLLESN